LISSVPAIDKDADGLPPLQKNFNAARVASFNLIMRLERQGRDTAAARALLALLEESLNLHMADRDRLLRALKEYSPAEDGTPPG
jgi:hypothetical protein